MLAFAFHTCEPRQRKRKWKGKVKNTGTMPPPLSEVESKMASSILDEKLAESVRKYPVLYDKSCADFKDKVAKELGLQNGTFYDTK